MRHPSGVIGPAEFCFSDCLSLATLISVIAREPDLSTFAAMVDSGPAEDRRLLE